MKVQTVSLLCILLITSCPAGGAQTSAATSQNVERGVQSFLAAWDTAWNAHDAEGILQLLADDCVTVNRFGKLFVGKQATVPQMQRLQKEVFKDAHFPPLRILNLRALTPDLVMIQAAWQNPSLRPPPAPQVNDMIVSMLLRRNGSGWLAEEVDLHNVESPPGPPAK